MVFITVFVGSAPCPKLSFSSSGLCFSPQLPPCLSFHEHTAPPPLPPCTCHPTTSNCPLLLFLTLHLKLSLSSSGLDFLPNHLPGLHFTNTPPHHHCCLVYATTAPSHIIHHCQFQQHTPNQAPAAWGHRVHPNCLLGLHFTNTPPHHCCCLVHATTAPPCTIPCCQFQRNTPYQAPAAWGWGFYPNHLSGSNFTNTPCCWHLHCLICTAPLLPPIILHCCFQQPTQNQAQHFSFGFFSPQLLPWLVFCGCTALPPPLPCTHVAPQHLPTPSPNASFSSAPRSKPQQLDSFFRSFFLSPIMISYAILAQLPCLHSYICIL